LLEKDGQAQLVVLIVPDLAPLHRFREEPSIPVKMIVSTESSSRVPFTPAAP
jgi:hypothetical protein